MDEWLTVFGGSARVLEQVLACFPDADIFSILDFFDPKERRIFTGRTVRTSFIQRLPMAEKRYRWYLPLMPAAVGRLDLSDYDLVISLNHACAKGIRTRRDQLHISYVHTPMRYAWDLKEDYLSQSGLHRGLKGWVARRLLDWLRRWDYRTAQRVDHVLANSAFVAQRIADTWQRTATVIHPPVAVDDFELVESKQDYYLSVSRLVPYKRIDLIVDAFAAMPSRRLIVAGDGPELPRIKDRAPPNVTILGPQPFARIRELMEGARAFVFAGKEDFGIVMAEAQACGTPVIAFGEGGAREIVRGLDAASPTGIFFERQTAEDIRDAVAGFERVQGDISPAACRANALRFSAERFRTEFCRFVADRIAEHRFNRMHSLAGQSFDAGQPDAAHALPLRASSGGRSG